MADTSPKSVVNAYYRQFQKDFSLFLKCRAEELVDGGCMILTLLGRRSQNPASKECCYIWELLALALNDMVSQVLSPPQTHKHISLILIQGLKYFGIALIWWSDIWHSNISWCKIHQLSHNLLVSLNNLSFSRHDISYLNHIR